MDFSDVLLTVDFDRTLTAPDSTIPRRNIEAIQYFIDNGGAFTVNTGRSLPMAGYFIGKVPVSAPLLLYNGSAHYDVETGSFTRTYPFDLDPGKTLETVIRMFPDLLVELQGVEAHYAFRKNEDWEILSTNCGCPWGYADTANPPLPFLKFALYGNCEGHTISSMYEGPKEELERILRVKQELEAAFPGKLEVVHPCPKIVDVHAPGVSKCRAARDLQQDMGRKILVCVGDAFNDLTMLEGADYSFCPADGLVADRFPNVCNCGEGAVADVIYRKIPEILK